MKDFTYSMPVEIVFGRGGENTVGEKIKEYGGSRVLIHYGGASAKKSGLLDRVKLSLEKSGLYYVELGGVKPNPRLSLSREGIALCKKEKIDFILAIGGGSVIDSAKCIAIGAEYDGDVWDYYSKPMPAPEKAVPLCTILTIAASGSESDNGSVMTDDTNDHKIGYSCEKMFPKFSVLNPELTFTLPAWQTAAGATDMIAHVLGSYINHQWDNELAHNLIEATIKTVLKNGPIAVKEPDNYEARANLMLASTACCNGSHTLGCYADGTSHVIEHELSALYDITHGAGLAVVIPGWFKYMVKETPLRFAQMAHRIFGVEFDGEDLVGTALKGIEKFEQWLTSIGMPTRLSQLGIDDSRFEEMAQRIEKDYGDCGYYSDIRKFTPEDTVNILRLCL